MGCTPRLQWPSPGLVLLAMCVAGFFLMLDRGITASNGVAGSVENGDQETVVTQFGLSQTQSGWIPSVYFVGVTLASPVYSLLSTKYKVSRIIGAGFVLWGFGELLCGFSPNYAGLLAFRFIVGAGAGVISLLPAVVDDVCPRKKAGLWLGALFITIPLGFAMGYVVGGAIGGSLGWRAAFWVQAGWSVLLAAFFLFTPPIELTAKRFAAAAAAAATSSVPTSASKGSEGSGEDVPAAEAGGAASPSPKESPLPLSPLSEAPAPPLSRRRRAGAAGAAAFAAHCRVLWAHPVSMVTVLGLGFWNTYLSAAGWWVPKASVSLFYLESFQSGEGVRVDIIFGCISAICGIIATLVGGLVLDANGKAFGGRPSLRKRLWMCFGLMTAAGTVGAVTFSTVEVAWAYWVLVAAIELLTFAMQSPGYGAAMASVPPLQRPMVLAAVEASQHLLGGIPGPPIVGAIQDATGNWHLTLALLSIATLLAAACFLGGALLARRRPDYGAAVAETAKAEAAAAAAVAAAAAGGGAATQPAVADDREENVRSV